MKLESSLTVYRADFITRKKGLGRWRKGGVPRHGAGGVPGGQAEQGKGWVMLLLGWSLLQEPKLQPLLQ